MQVQLLKMRKLQNNRLSIGVESVQKSQKGMEKIISSAQHTGKIINSLAKKSDQIRGDCSGNR